ncbi:MAG: hypothetical protein ACK5TH_06495 [Prosthecobacter sp.]
MPCFLSACPELDRKTGNAYDTFITLITFVFTLGLSIAVEPSTPKMGSADRKVIMDALRGPVQSELENPVVFKVNSLRVLNGWAFLNGVLTKRALSERKNAPKLTQSRKVSMRISGLCAFA